MAKISVLIPAFNAQAYIRQTIQSVLDQTYPDWELIIVDDCSVDMTFKICQEISLIDNRIKLFRNEHNLGMMANWNKGLGLCHSEYFVKLDADDWWHSRMLEKCILVMNESTDIGITFCKYDLVNGENEIQPRLSNNLPDFARDRSFYGAHLVTQGIYKMLSENVFRQGIGLVRRGIFDEIGGFTLHDSGDVEMWFRISAHYKAYGIDEVLYFYREWPDNFTRTQVLAKRKEEKNLFELRRMILQYYFDLGSLSSDAYEEFIKDNQFEYTKYLIYQNRMEGNWLKVFNLFLQNFERKPLATLKFYVNRLFLRL
jgi:glycosyltransferase involved in cell wall biosynthesis